VAASPTAMNSRLLLLPLSVIEQRSASSCVHDLVSPETDFDFGIGE
jgi:hypothetical protein